MTFQKKKLKTRYTKSTTKRKYTKKKKSTGGVLKFLTYLIVFFFISSGLGGVILYKKYIADLPSINELENLNIAESSTIHDRDGNELYKIFKEKRTYVEYENISKNMIRAIIAGEDKTFFENPGVDLKGIFRAVFNYVTGKTTKIEGTSTISQQLIRNTIIANERKIERKIKEIYLSYKMNKGLSKEKILELYLNKISFGSNAYGIEQAAQTFFGTKASEVGVLESSILASLPKGPTYYSPYNHPDRVLGYPYVYNIEDEKNINKIITSKDYSLNKDLVNSLKENISNMQAKRLSDSKTLICGLNEEYLKNNLRVDNDSCLILDYSGLLHLLNSIQIKDGDSIIEYQVGRKDFILGRMLEDKYIDFEEYKDAILTSIAFEFNKYKENIKAPHFVFYVREYLEKKYGKESIEAGGLKIYTTLDSSLQEKAQELVEKYSTINEEKFEASNAALISLDNKSGDILAMVGGKDYFDTENKGNVNITTSRLQPGSTFKPFVYSMGMYNEQIGTKTPIYDLETEFPNYTPANFDGEFMGQMNISTALNSSRNIPAVKMFYMAGGERETIKFMQKLGVESLKTHGDYGAPLALGTGEMTALELAGAYSVFANLGKKVEINPILKIVDSKGNIIEEKAEEIESEEVISSAQAYIVNHMLSDTSTRPEFWNMYLSLTGRKVAAKTGTSTKQYKKGDKKDIYPRNLWTAGYTPQITTITWAGNTTGKELNYKGNGLEGAGPIWKDFMEFAHKGERVESWKKPSKVKEINISSISGLLPSPESTNTNFIVKSLFLNPPKEYDNSLIPVQIDALCNGKVTSNTPEAAIRNVNLVQFHSIYPSNPKWENPVKEWIKSNKMKEQYGNIPNIITDISYEPCKRDIKEGKIEIASTTQAGDIFIHGANYIELAYRGTNPIIKVDVLIGEEKIGEIKLRNKTSGVYKGNIYIPTHIVGKQILSLRAVDSGYYSNEEQKEIIVNKKDNTPPTINITNPSDLSITLYKDEFFNLRGEVSDRGPIRVINIYIDNESYKIGLKDLNFVEAISGENLSLGEHILRVDAIDDSFNTGSVEVKINVIQK